MIRRVHDERCSKRNRIKFYFNTTIIRKSMWLFFLYHLVHFLIMFFISKPKGKVILHLSSCVPFEWVDMTDPDSDVLPSHWLRRIKSMDQWRCQKPCSKQMTSPVTSPSGGYDWRRARLNDLEHVTIKITHRVFHCERVLCVSDLALVDESLFT